MNHNELIGKIYKEVEIAEFEDACGDGNNPKVAKTLLVVAGLHKPFEVPEKLRKQDSMFEQGLACYLCSTEMFEPYPCPTIYAIEVGLE
jgi:hypothetical protein